MSTEQPLADKDSATLIGEMHDLLETIYENARMVGKLRAAQDILARYGADGSLEEVSRFIEEHRQAAEHAQALTMRYALELKRRGEA